MALITWALVRRQRNSLRARSIRGNLVVGDNTGTLNQTYSSADGTEPAAPDRVAWAIGIVGVLVAAAALAHDIFWAK